MQCSLYFCTERYMKQLSIILFAFVLQEPDPHYPIIRLLIHFCCGFSILFLLIALMMSLYIRKWMTKRIVIYRNLILSMLLCHISVIIAVHMTEIAEVSHQSYCFLLASHCVL